MIVAVIVAVMMVTMVMITGMMAVTAVVVMTIVVTMVGGDDRNGGVTMAVVVGPVTRTQSVSFPRRGPANLARTSKSASRT